MAQPQPPCWGPAAPLAAPAAAAAPGGMKPLEKFLKKQGSHLAGRPGPGAGGGGGGGGNQLSRRPSVSKILLPGFLKDEPAEAGPEGDGRWLELRPPEGALRSPTSFSSEELSPAGGGGGGGGGDSQLSPEAAVPTCCWAPLAEPESPERLLETLLERLAGDPTAPHGHGCGAGKAPPRTDAGVGGETTRGAHRRRLLPWSNCAGITVWPPELSCVGRSGFAPRTGHWSKPRACLSFHSCLLGSGHKRLISEGA